MPSQHDFEAIHGILSQSATRRYLDPNRTPIVSKVAYVQPYDTAYPACDYDKTWWPTTPVPWFSEFAGRKVISAINGVSSKVFDENFIPAFDKKAEATKEALRESPVAILNGHSPDIQAAISLHAAQIAVARSEPGSYQRNLMNMIKISHGIATRGIVPVMIGNPKFKMWLPGGMSKTPHIPFMRVTPLVVAAHYSIPNTKQSRKANFPKEFVEYYNDKVQDDAVVVAQSPPTHPQGYNTLWSLSAGGGPDDIPEEGEHTDKIVTKIVTEGTVKWLKTMGVSLIPAYTSVKDKDPKTGERLPTKVEFGEIIPADEIDADKVHTIHADQAEFRRQNGASNVYYAGELAA